MLTSLDLTDSVTDLTSSSSSDKTLTDTEASRERQSDTNTETEECVRNSECKQWEKKERMPDKSREFSCNLKHKIVTEV